MTVKELYERLSLLYPAALSCDWDNDGMLCAPAPDAEVVRVLCTLDVTEAAIAEAVKVGANVILSHHPLIFHSSLLLDHCQDKFLYLYSINL